jgi:sulfite reductase alpha subunit-like flavoprotein
MAKDVDDALREVFAREGGRDAAGAKALLAEMAKKGRYARDVY